MLPDRFLRPPALVGSMGPVDGAPHPWSCAARDGRGWKRCTVDDVVLVTLLFAGDGCLVILCPDVQHVLRCSLLE